MTQASRVAIVTGGIGGLGSAMCVRLAQAGRRVIAADLGSRTDRIGEFQKEVAEFGDSISFEPVDVTDHESCASLVQRVTEKHGPVDILVNAAGITRDSTLRKMTASQWTDVMRVNLDSVFNLSKLVIDGMTDRGFGRIVNISSVNGQTGQFGQTNYSAAKAGMHGFTMALAREVARKGVTVNSVSPGYCETALVMQVPADVREKILSNVPVGRLGKPSEIARTVEFLTNDEAGFITGANIPVNGGLFVSF